MRVVFGFLIGIALFGINTTAQKPEVCTISWLVVPSAATENDVDRYKPVDIATIDISGVTEGTRESRTFRIPGTSLWAYVELFFDDDMKFYDSLYPALSVDVVFSTAKRRTKTNVVGLTATHTAFDERFKQTEVAGIVRVPGKRVEVLVVCRGKKPKDE
jgi:hypothetical protein